MKIQPKLVYLEWCDVVASDGDWYNIQDISKWIDKNEIWLSQVGFIVFQSKEYIVLAGHVPLAYEETTNDEYGHLIKIPTPLVKNIIDLSDIVQDKLKKKKYKKEKNNEKKIKT